MTDIYHAWGNDLALSPTGDLETATGSLVVQQRVLRRLLTALGDYIQHLDYGAGLGQFVGQPTNALIIRGLVLRQMKKEASVLQTPAPTVDVVPGTGGLVTLTIGYFDNGSAQQQVLNVPLGG